MTWETIRGATAIDCMSDLEREAMLAQRMWFANPDSLDHKLSYAAALRRWGKADGPKGAVAHADALEAGTA